MNHLFLKFWKIYNFIYKYLVLKLEYKYTRLVFADSKISKENWVQIKGFLIIFLSLPMLLWRTVEDLVARFPTFK